MTLIPYQDPYSAMLDISDSAAWEGERKTAKELEDLQSPSGMPYHEEKKEDQSLSFLDSEPCYAKTDFEISSHCPLEEVAYYCSHEGLWIQGVPSGEEYDEIVPLGGSAGISLLCRLCGKKIGRIIRMRS